MPLLAPGTVLSDRYVVGRVLGGGGMGEVYEAVQKGLARRVAIKLLKPELAHNAEMLSRFRREAEAAAALGHPNIVQVTDLCVAPGEAPYLVMEHLEGRSLHDILASEGRLQTERAVFIARQILSALSAAHAAQIVHRDIKPANVFVLRTLAVSDIVKLLDFGVAKLLEPAGSRGSGALTHAGEVLGTTSYMAPEQALGMPVDARADLFAVGAVLFHALSGVRAREPGDAEAAAFDRIKRLGEVTPWIEPRLAAVVDRALHRDPAGRWASAEEMARELAPFVPRSGGVFDQTVRDREDPMETTQRDSAPPVTSKPTASMARRPSAATTGAERVAIPAPTVSSPSTTAEAEVAPTASSPPMTAPLQHAATGTATAFASPATASPPVAPTVLEAPLRDPRDPPDPRDVRDARDARDARQPHAPVRESWQPPMPRDSWQPAPMPMAVAPYGRPSYPAPSPSNRLLVPPPPLSSPTTARSWGVGLAIGLVVVVLTGVGLVLGLVGLIVRRGSEASAERRAMIASATACPRPATCTGSLDVGGAVAVCAPESLGPSLVVRGDVIVVRRGTDERVGRIEDVSSGGVFVLREPSGSAATFAKSEIRARVCR